MKIRHKYPRRQHKEQSYHDPLSREDVWFYRQKPHRWGFAVLRPVRWIQITSVSLIVFCAILQMVPARIIGYFIDDVLRNRDMTNFVFLIILMAALPLIEAGLYFVGRACAQISSQYGLAVLRDILFDRLMRSDQRFFQNTPPGEIMARLTGDLDMVRYYWAWLLNVTFEQTALFIIGGIYLFFLNWILALTSLFLTPLIVYLASRYSKEIRPFWTSIRRQFEKLNTVVEENITGNRVVRAFVKADYETERFEVENDAYRNMNQDATMVSSRYHPLLNAIGTAMSIPVLLVGGILVINGTMSLGELVTFNSLLYVISSPARQAGFIIGDLQRYTVSAEKIIDMLGMDPEIKSPQQPDSLSSPAAYNRQTIRPSRPMRIINWFRTAILRRDPLPAYLGYPYAAYTERKARALMKDDLDALITKALAHEQLDLTPLRGEIEFRDVSFDYRKGEQKHPVLEDISFTIKPGEVIGITGATGSGKTTLVRLLARLYDPSRGEVRIDGKPLPEYDLRRLRANIGVVTQEVFLFSDTIEGNIAYGRPHMPFADIEASAEAAQAADFIARTADGYGTIIGERGTGLSGGQKQRISLARALAIRPPILVLDDTTSAVDAHTDIAIRANLKQLDWQPTTIIIAHRIASLRHADRIF
ncbi:MAG: ABC transporter ATP-binding protein, partial [Clostridiaceae bacterium]|nr:ABC transporter ATP-binding protein [Clostridiaceae bacterium]